MTTMVQVKNVGHYDIKVNVWETSSPANEGATVESYDLSPGAETQPITIYGWRRGVTILEMAAAEDTSPQR